MPRPHARQPAKPKIVKKVKGPETFEEFMEAGIESEEQGERYKTGERAQRRYENAVEMYSKAYSLNPNDADCLYNWGRVLFLLVNFLPTHYDPEDKLEKIDNSINKLRKALELEQGKTDIQFNLAQALHQRAETLQDTTEIDNAYSQSAIALQEAIGIFESVYQLQEKEYKEHRSQTKTENILSEEEHVHTSECQHEHESAPKETTETTNTTDTMATVTQVEPTTAASLIDTLLSTSETMASMASMLASFQASTDLFGRARAKLSLAEKWLMEITEKEDGYKPCRIQINLKQAQCFSAMADRSFLSSGKVDHSLFSRSIECLDQVIEQFDSSNVEAMCDRGDILTSFAQALSDEAERTKTPLIPETTGKDIWQLFAQATSSFQAALKIESKNLNILNKLGDLCMIRAKLQLPVAERNRPQLLKNGEFYYKQAVQANKQVLTSGWIGWGHSLWAQEELVDLKGKRVEASKVMKMWINYGGSHEMFDNITEDSSILDPSFIEWVVDNFFDDSD
ncbi:hypothetical protein BDF14DRAFT_1954390 [Spinellus fusiger]|nr:hypothetical protein BDF14DRAFT_1954390 [Spinellus fusiger]